MKMTGEEIIAAPRQVVWDALNDPDVLKQCITGCEEIKKKSDTELEAKVTAKVGPVKASFVGAVKLSKLNPPRSYVISGEGKGGVAGFAKGGATVQLSDTADGHTKLSYDVDAQVGGKLAQIGSRLIDSTAKKMATDFFKKFNKVVSELAQGAGTEGKSKAGSSQEDCGKGIGHQDCSRGKCCQAGSEKDGQKAGQQGKCGRWCGQEGCKEGTEDDCGGQFSGKGFREVCEDVGQVRRRLCEGGSQDGLQNREQGSKEGVQQGFQCCKLGCFRCRKRGSRSPSSLGSDGGNGDQCRQDGSGFCQPGR
jgi:carbon monoxide dehydrogenase subunit G